MEFNRCFTFRSQEFEYNLIQYVFNYLHTYCWAYYGIVTNRQIKINISFQNAATIAEAAKEQSTR